MTKSERFETNKYEVANSREQHFEKLLGSTVFKNPNLGFLVIISIRFNLQFCPSVASVVSAVLI